jgi:hypothetical protein
MTAESLVLPGLEGGEHPRAFIPACDDCTIAGGLTVVRAQVQG